MQTLRNTENENVFGARPKGVATNVIRKPLRGLENKVSNIPRKNEKSEITGFKKFEKEQKLVKSLKPTCGVFKEVLENVVELKKSLPVIESHSAKQLPSDIENIDLADAENPQLVSLYINDIYSYLRSLELMYPIKKCHLQLQPDITGKMRAILVDWLVQVHLRFHLLQETLFMTVSVLDRYLQVEKVKRSDLQLVGITSMFIASKYEEIYPPDISDLVYITDNTYSKHDILKMEKRMLYQLKFELSKPLPLHFLRRNSKAGNVDATIHTLAKYFIEVVMTEYDCAHYRPSHLAAAALYLARKLLLEVSWNDTLKFYSNYDEEDLIPVAKKLCKILLKVESSKLQAVHMKYSSSKLYKISTIPQLKSPVVIELASGIN